MRYFMDTEFIEDGRTIDLISLGIVAEDGRELHLGNRECDFSKASPWVRDNVLTPMGFEFAGVAGLPMRPVDASFWVGRKTIAGRVAEFVGALPYRAEDGSLKFKLEDGLEKPEFWAYYADYDWVVLCQLFGTMMDLPKGFPMYCRDIKQYCDSLGNPKLPEQGKGEHNALADARWNKVAWEYLQAYSESMHPEI